MQLKKRYKLRTECGLLIDEGFMAQMYSQYIENRAEGKNIDEPFGYDGVIEVNDEGITTVMEFGFKILGSEFTTQYKKEDEIGPLVSDQIEQMFSEALRKGPFLDTRFDGPSQMHVRSIQDVYRDVVKIISRNPSKAILHRFTISFIDISYVVTLLEQRNTFILRNIFPLSCVSNEVLKSELKHMEETMIHELIDLLNKNYNIVKRKVSLDGWDFNSRGKDYSIIAHNGTESAYDLHEAMYNIYKYDDGIYMMHNLYMKISGIEEGTKIGVVKSGESNIRAAVDPNLSLIADDLTIRLNKLKTTLLMLYGVPKCW